MTRITLQYFFIFCSSRAISFLPASSDHFFDALVNAFFLEDPLGAAARGRDGQPAAAWCPERCVLGRSAPGRAGGLWRPGRARLIAPGGERRLGYGGREQPKGRLGYGEP